MRSEGVKIESIESTEECSVAETSKKVVNLVKVIFDRRCIRLNGDGNIWVRITIGEGPNGTHGDNQPPLMASPGTASEYKHVGQPIQRPDILGGVDEIPTMTETVKVPLFCESENKVVSGEGYSEVLRLEIGGGSMMVGDEEVEYTGLERGEDCVDCMSDWVVGVDEELPKSGLALTTECTLTVELESRGPVFLHVWSPGVGERPNFHDTSARAIPVGIVADEGARQRGREFRVWNQFKNLVTPATTNDQLARIHCEVDLLESKRDIIQTRRCDHTCQSDTNRFV